MVETSAEYSSEQIIEAYRQKYPKVSNWSEAIERARQELEAVYHESVSPGQAESYLAVGSLLRRAIVPFRSVTKSSPMGGTETGKPVDILKTLRELSPIFVKGNTTTVPYGEYGSKSITGFVWSQEMKELAKATSDYLIALKTASHASDEDIDWGTRKFADEFTALFVRHEKKAADSHINRITYSQLVTPQQQE